MGSSSVRLALCMKGSGVWGLYLAIQEASLRSVLSDWPGNCSMDACRRSRSEDGNRLKESLVLNTPDGAGVEGRSGLKETLSIPDGLELWTNVVC